MRIILTLLLVFFFFVSVTPPSFASDTITAQCARYPQACASFADDLAISTSVAQPLATTNQAVPVVAEVLDASGTVIATTYAGTTTVASGSNPVLGILAGGIVTGGITASGVDALRNKATDKLSLLQPNDGLTTYVIRFYSPNNNSTVTVGGVTSYRVEGNIIYWTAPGNNGDANISPSTLEVTTFRRPWGDLTQAQRNSATALLTPSDYIDALETGSIIPYPGGGSAVRVKPNGSPITVLPPFGSPQTINSPTDFPYGVSDTDDDGIPDTEDPDDDNDGMPDTEDPDDDNDGLLDPYDILGDIPTYESPECIECEPQFQNVPNFVSYAIDKAIDKFPFDILGDWAVLQENASNECPVYTFWEVERQLCFVRDLFVGLKFSVWASFIVRMILSI